MVSLPRDLVPAAGLPAEPLPADGPLLRASGDLPARVDGVALVDCADRVAVADFARDGFSATCSAWADLRLALGMVVPSLVWGLSSMQGTGQKLA
ncbi:protein of unknown function [Cupriavidus taiwanensis]|uniref:Uncharacterized protein n=1 Tax=Cupriavidus taiwanensis TaxID=164546 RepID=A0A7Z7JB88_9BURK|nr:protein of unknown function [Cupriavidus taiwanensis]SPC21555.1 protein of unknown function [Cupriavidus taiwanensis]